MGLKSLFRSFKNAFWFRSISEDLEEQSATPDEYDVFYKVDDAGDVEDDLKGLKPWIKQEFDDPEIVLNDPDVMEDYIVLSLDVETPEGKFRLVYYENDELILRGDRVLVPDLEEPVGRKLGLEFKRV